VIAWPDRIKDGGGIRAQLHHVIDISPTILEAAHLSQPVEVNGVKQKPIEGVRVPGKRELSTTISIRRDPQEGGNPHRASGPK
jgi:arylsulfatase A-like enzyme